MNLTVLTAIFKRDFVNYFASATGYVFICVFVILSSLAAFWPDEFFSANLANLDQLSRWMPMILLVFVPAITMSIWAEERRRGTDELLLTLPAADSDVVIGKYLAAVAIFTVSLLFSMASILLIFSYGLGEPDPLLFCCTFLGYWFVGLAMLATGMVASFLTSNLTVGFILGVLFNAPQALASFVDRILEWFEAVPLFQELAQREAFRDFARGVVSSFSAFEGFSDFSRGVLSLSGALHFLCIVVLMLYLSMVLIGRRHWAGGDDGESLWWHYLVRGVALFLIVGGVNTMLRNHDRVRIDMTVDKINSLSPKTIELVRDLKNKTDLPTIKIDAYVSPQVPSEYVGQKFELLSAMEEMRSISGGKVAVVKHEIENFSEEATRAERTYGIEARPVTTKVRGATEQEEIFLGVAVSCGLDKVVIPFLDKGLPVEYELVRSITTVADEKRKRVGVVKTDAPLFSGFTMQGQTPESQLIAELKKQYEVIEVDPANPITDSYDVLLAVQPSSLSPEAMDNFVAAVKTGQPTAIFEDPAPIVWSGVVGTDEPKRQGGGGMMGMFGGGQTVPKGDLQQLWKLLGSKLDSSEIIAQQYNPYSGFPQASPEWLFIDANSGAEQPFNPESEISAGMQQVLLLYAGAVQKTPGSKTEAKPLAVTSDLTGATPTSMVQRFFSRMASPADLERARRKTGRTYVVASHITGRPPEQEDVLIDENIDDDELRDELAGVDSAEEAPAEEPSEEAGAEEIPKVNVVIVGDIDCLADDFFAIRAMGDDEQMPVDFRFQNVQFVLNILDVLAGDDRYVALRKRTRDYRTLVEIENATEESREQALKDQDEFRKEAEAEIEAANQRFRDKVAEIENRNDLPPDVKRQLLEEVRIREERIRDVKIVALQQELQKKIRQSERDLAKQVRNVQDRYKAAAIFVPPIPPMLLGLWVYFRRRSMEAQGVAKERLRYSKAETKPKTPEPVA